jgi:Xaa-Pro aminopeptidase
MVSQAKHARSGSISFVLEPGYYADGRYGIRIESIVIVREAKTPNNFGNGYLCFENVTMVSASR